MVQMIMRDLKRVFALWSVHFRVSTLERFRYKEFLRNSSGIKFFVRVRKVSALGRFHYISFSQASNVVKLIESLAYIAWFLFGVP